MKKPAFFMLLGLLIAGCASQRYLYGGGCIVGREGTSTVELSVIRSDESIDTLPVPKTPAFVAIPFPLEMRRVGIVGEVLATAAIEEDGRISSVVIDRASQPEFAVPVASGLPRCTFFPARRGGVAVRCVAQCKIQFILEDE